MPTAAKGLYAPRIVDLTFALMGLGSAALLSQGGKLALTEMAVPGVSRFAGPVLLASVLLIGTSACLMHKIDRKGWDDYMGQIVSQSALIAMVTLLLTGVLFDFILTPSLRITTPPMMIQGMIPIACLGWALGYGFLRWKGTGA